MRLTKEELRNLEIIVKYGESDWSEHPEGFEALAKNYHNDLMRLLAHVESLPTDQPMWGILFHFELGEISTKIPEGIPTWYMENGIVFATPNKGHAIAQQKWSMRVPIDDGHIKTSVRQFGPDGKPMEETE